MVHRVVFLTNFGELPYGAAAGEAPVPASSPSASAWPPMRDLSRPIVIQRPLTELTLSTAILLNSPRALGVLNPRSKAHKRDYVFSVLKAYSLQPELKYVFDYSQVCH